MSVELHCAECQEYLGDLGDMLCDKCIGSIDADHYKSQRDEAVKMLEEVLKLTWYRADGCPIGHLKLIPEEKAKQIQSVIERCK